MGQRLQNIADWTVLGRCLPTCRDDGLLSVVKGLCCEVCGDEYHVSKRFPETLAELVCATLDEWRWLLKRCLLVVALFAWIHSLVQHYLAPDGVSEDLCLLMVFTSSMMAVTLTPRFHRGVQMIWNTPNRQRYFRLFGVFALCLYLASLRACHPSVLANAAARRPWVAMLSSMLSVIH